MSILLKPKLKVSIIPFGLSGQEASFSPYSQLTEIIELQKKWIIYQVSPGGNVLTPIKSRLRTSSVQNIPSNKLTDNGEFLDFSRETFFWTEGFLKLFYKNKVLRITQKYYVHVTGVSLIPSDTSHQASLHIFHSIHIHLSILSILGCSLQ